MHGVTWVPCCLIFAQGSNGRMHGLCISGAGGACYVAAGVYMPTVRLHDAGTGAMMLV